MNPSILIIDDSKIARQEIVNILKRTSLFQFFYEASNGIEGFKMVLNTPPDVIICDLEMPDMDGFKFLSMLNSKEDLRDIPVIMVTGREDQDAKIQGLELGASDYVTKPFDAGEMVARVKVQLKIKSLQDSLKQTNHLLLELSNTDPLTHLFNRRCLMENLTKELERSARTNTPLSLLMVDIDHFKKVNDTFGHQQGDVVLQALADLLRAHLRQYDVPSRFGGEEFSLVLPQTDLVQAAHVAERQRQAAAELSFAGQLKDLKITVSIGVATFPGGNVKTVDDLIREADYALYNAKREGRNRVETMAI